MSELFWEMRQTRMIKEAAGAASAAGSHAVITDHKVGNLADRVDQLTLVCKAMWALIQECTDLTEEDLLKKVQDVDYATFDVLGVDDILFIDSSHLWDLDGDVHVQLHGSHHVERTGRRVRSVPHGERALGQRGGSPPDGVGLS